MCRGSLTKYIQTSTSLSHGVSLGFNPPLTEASFQISQFLPLASMAAVTGLFWFIALIAPVLASAKQGAEIQSEIAALTSFKMNLLDPLGALSNWNSSSPLAPCDWRGIVCSDDRVTELILQRLRLTGPITDRLSELHMLRKLNLRSNAFNGTIPASLSKCTSLQEVLLQYNSLSGSLPVEIANLTNLQTLSLAQNMLSGAIPGVLPTNLNYLDLSSNSFSGEIPNNISSLTYLKLVNFSYNQFGGEIPPSFGQLQNLQYLVLDYNILGGTLPSAIANCSSLLHLSVEGNSLRGVISTSIGALPNLQVVSLSHNSLSGSVPSSFICNASLSPPSLQVVQLGFNAFTELGEPQEATCLSVLQVLDLQRNQITGSFRSWLTQISTLTTLDISGNSFSGEISTDIGKLLMLEELKMADNLFTGEIPDSFSHMNGLKVLSLEGNSFSGSAPPSIANLLKLETLNLRGNDLTGSFLIELIGLTNLTTLDLSGNNFSGEIPAGINNLNQLVSLNLSNSGFSGHIPSGLGNLLKLTTLDLSKQSLSGELPFELFGLPNLQVIELQENMLSGNLPDGFSSLMGLSHLNLSLNRFTGSISSNFGFLSSLAILSLSGNQITGDLPQEIGNCSDLRVLELRSNLLVGHIPSELSPLTYLKILDLGVNNFSGEIPEEISRCLSLNKLLLNGNNLSGIIPGSFSKLSNLTALDFSANHLSGAIPAGLNLIPGLVSFNVSSNNLEGEIPWALGSRFNNPSVFAYNQKLCGKPLNRKCDDNAEKDRKKKLILLMAVAATGACLLFLCCCFYIYSLLKWRTKFKGLLSGEKRKSPARVSSATASGGRGSSDSGGPRLAMFNDMITVAETVEATRQFDEENVLSRTRYGLVFKACYNDGMVLSIRRLADNSIDENVFRNEAEILGKLKHRNITVLRGYYAGPPPDLRLLAYDYMPNGNLATLLQEASHQDGQVLNWPMRHLIAIGIARGLAYLHSSAVVHGDVKPQNVLFDADFEAHLSDFGLTRFTASVSTSVGTVGYVSPEAAITGEVTKESDIYSFGILILELLSGKRPVMFSEDEDLVKWVKKQLQMGQITELLELGLLKLDPESLEWDEFLLGIKVGLLCTAADPFDRPPMSEVVFMLEGCRIRPEVSSSADPASQSSPAEADNRV